MKIIVFGATGLVGKQLVQQALFKGHHVRAFGRNVFTENLPKDDNLELIHGALFDEGQVYKAIKDCDAVLSVIGGSPNDSDVTRSLGMKNIVKQMEKAGVKRIVALGGQGSLDESEDVQTPLMDSPEFPPEFYHVSKEHYKAYQTLKASHLDWTFLCPPGIIDADPTGDFVTSADYPPTPNNYKINSGDVALFMLNELDKNAFVNHRAGISN